MTSRTRSVIADRLVAVLCWSAAALTVAAFGGLLWDLAWSGAGRISWTFLTTEPRDAGRAGGISTILVSTALVLGVAVGTALPTGVGCAAYLTEFAPQRGRTARLIGRSLDLLASIPSIVFGLFGMVFFCEVLGMGFSILAGGLTLAGMILPIVVRTTYAGFRSVPDELRFGAAALGMTRTATLRHLLVPGAMHGIVIGTMLGIGRATAETAALIFTSGYVTRMPGSLFDSGRTLSVHIYDLAMNVPGGEPNAHAGAVVLLLFLVSVNLTASWLADLWLRTKVAS